MKLEADSMRSIGALGMAIRDECPLKNHRKTIKSLLFYSYFIQFQDPEALKSLEFTSQTATCFTYP